MAKHNADPVLAQLVHSVNESRQATVPVTIFLHGTVLNGTLIAQDRYFADLVEGNPLMSALQPASGLLGKEYAKDVEAEAGHHLHLRNVRVEGLPGDAVPADGPWRISLAAVDAWTLRTIAGAGAHDDRGPFARLLGTP
jgi:hypothetical protein